MSLAAFVTLPTSVAIGFSILVSAVVGILALIGALCFGFIFGFMVAFGLGQFVLPLVLACIVRAVGSWLKKTSARTERTFYICCSLSAITLVLYLDHPNILPLPERCQTDEVEVRLDEQVVKVPASKMFSFYSLQINKRIDFGRGTDEDLRALCWRKSSDQPLEITSFAAGFGRFETSHKQPKRVEVNFDDACPTISKYLWGEEICTSLELPSELGYPVWVRFGTADMLQKKPPIMRMGLEELTALGHSSNYDLKKVEIDGFWRLLMKRGPRGQRDHWGSLPDASSSGPAFLLNCKKWGDENWLQCEVSVQEANGVSITYEIEGQSRDIPAITRRAYAKISMIFSELSI